MRDGREARGLHFCCAFIMVLTVAVKDVRILREAMVVCGACRMAA